MRVFYILFFLSFNLFLFGQIHMDLNPSVSLFNEDNKNVEQLSLKDFYDWNERNDLVNLYILLNNNFFDIYMQIDIKSDLGSDLSNGVSSLYHDGNFYLDPNFPQVGYGELVLDDLLLSIGRRKLKIGPGYYSLGISNLIPYLDSIWFSSLYRTDKGGIQYNFVVATTDFMATSELDSKLEDLNYKTLMAHTISYIGNQIILSLTDYSLIENRVPDLQELGPFIHYHGLYQSGQNVMLGFSLDYKPLNNLRLYSETVIDDFQLSIESDKSNPGAMGFLMGIEYLIADEYKCLNIFDSPYNHQLSTPSYGFSKGLYVRYEAVWTSPYLYNREDETGKYTNPYLYMWEYDTYVVNSFFGAIYGPNRFINRISLNYDKAFFKSGLVFEHHIVGASGIEQEYKPPYEEWIKITEPYNIWVRSMFFLDWYYESGKKVSGRVTIDFEDSIDFRLELGWGIHLF